MCGCSFDSGNGADPRISCSFPLSVFVLFLPLRWRRVDDFPFLVQRERHNPPKKSRHLTHLCRRSSFSVYIKGGVLGWRRSNTALTSEPHPVMRLFFLFSSRSYRLSRLSLITFYLHLPLIYGGGVSLGPNRRLLPVYFRIAGASVSGNRALSLRHCPFFFFPLSAVVLFRLSFFFLFFLSF